LVEGLQLRHLLLRAKLLLLKVKDFRGLMLGFIQKLAIRSGASGFGCAMEPETIAKPSAAQNRLKIQLSWARVKSA
jgi:hypothetical protein